MKLLLFNLFVVCFGPIYGQVIYKDKLIEDYRIFTTSLEETHPGLYWYKSKTEIDSLFNITKQKLTKDMTLKEFYEVLSNNVDFIGCGHSTILYPKFYIQKIDSINRFLPFGIRLFGNKIYVSESMNTEIPNGSEILNIDNLSAMEIYRIISSKIPTDKNILTKKERTFELLFPFLYSLHIGQSEVCKIKINCKNEIRNLEIKSIEWQKDKWFKSVKEYALSQYPITFEISKNFALLKIRTFSPMSFKKNNINFEDTISKIFTICKQNNCKKLVLDLRDNNGGSLGFGSILFSFLTDTNFQYFSTNEIKYKVAKGEFSNNKYCDDPITAMPLDGLINQENERFIISRTDTTYFEKNNFKGNVFIITNGLTFSSTSLFVSYCKTKRKNTYILGETPGGALSGCNGGGPVSINLPNSKLILFFYIIKLNLNISESKSKEIKVDKMIIDKLNQDLNKIDLFKEFIIKN